MVEHSSVAVIGLTQVAQPGLLMEEHWERMDWTALLVPHMKQERKLVVGGLERYCQE